MELPVKIDMKLRQVVGVDTKWDNSQLPWLRRIKNWHYLLHKNSRSLHFFKAFLKRCGLTYRHREGFRDAI
jgi:hypothetical protein